MLVACEGADGYKRWPGGGWIVWNRRGEIKGEYSVSGAKGPDRADNMAITESCLEVCWLSWGRAG